MNNKNKGFTLVELMITVAIIGILSAIAMPSYLEYARKSKRTEAKVELLKIAQLQESYYVQNLSYASGFNGTAANGKLGFSSNSLESETGLYEISITSVDSRGRACSGTNADPCTSYNLFAKPISGAGQDADENCAEFRMSSNGAKAARSKRERGFGSQASRDRCWN